MHRFPRRLVAALVVLVGVAACRPEFQLKNFTTNEALYAASLREYQRHHWDNAVTGFEKLTTDLPPRDTLLPRSYWYLASAHEHMDEHLLAAQSFSRLVETFPEDSLADDAALEAARSYRRMWRKPQLDPTYGETALASYNTLIGLYPTSPLDPVGAEGDRRAGELVRDQGLRRRDVLLPAQGVRLGHHLFQGRPHQVREHADGARRGASPRGRRTRTIEIQGRRQRHVHAGPPALPEGPACRARCARAFRTRPPREGGLGADGGREAAPPPVATER